ncbi:uncharacterized protein TNCV_11841 [Trichonephila clavipes]|nr:uncharacterized protein TNCV_11841 [Trichonephila clavipes]
MITKNIDVTDGLVNGALGKLVHVETNYEGLVKTIWLEVPDLPQIGKKLRRKVPDYAAEINVSRMAVPIVLRSSNIPFNNNKTIFVKRTHVPLCALGAGGIIGPYFFKNDEGHNVTVNGDRYRAMITNFFIPELNNHDVQELWFQQDGASCHTARATNDLLKDTFGDRLISRFGPVNWPPRFCDLTPLDYFLWVYVKSLIYADKPQTLDHLEDNIRRVIADIRPQMLEKVIENGTSRLDYIRTSRGSHMPEIIFNM